MRTYNLSRLDALTLPQLERILDHHTQEEIPVNRYTAFSWSNSRHGMFERCRRQYYLNYYGSRRVREAHDKAVSAIWWLKQVTPIRMWIGTVIHEVAQFAVRQHAKGHPVARDEVLSRAMLTYQEGIQASQRGTKRGSQWLVLFEHLYPDDPPFVGEGNPEQVAEQIVRERAEAFLDSEGWQLIQSLPPDHVAEADEEFQSFTLTGVPEMPGGVTVFAIPDVLLYDGKHITIIDWKTGSVGYESIHHQAGVYRLYAHLTYDLPQEAITVKIADLAGDGTLIDPPGGTPSLDEAEQFVRGSIAQMFASLQSIDYNTVAIKDFPRTDNLSDCQMCGFKRACWRHTGAGST